MFSESNRINKLRSLRLDFRVEVGDYDSSEFFGRNKCHEEEARDGKV